MVQHKYGFARSDVKHEHNTTSLQCQYKEGSQGVEGEDKHAHNSVQSGGVLEMVMDHKTY